MTTEVGFQPPRTVRCQQGEYVVGRLLGAGSNKQVYVATNKSGRQIAVLFQKVADVQTAEREFDYILRCRQIPGVVHALNEPQFFIEADGQCYIQLVTHVCDQGTLVPWSENKTLRDRLRIVLQAAKTVQRLHGIDLVHGDIKSENIGVRTIFQGKYRGMLLDLGCMHAAAENLSQGTPHYMPPGPSSADADPRAQDIFALGATLYEVVLQEPSLASLFLDVSRLAGRERNPHIYLINATQKEITAAIARLDICESIKQLLKRMLVCDPMKRCSIIHVVMALCKILEKEPTDVLNERAGKIPEPGAPLLKDASKPSF